MSELLCCLAFGTRGDVEPVLHVARHWRADSSKRVKFVTHEAHRAWLEAKHLEKFQFRWVSTPACLPSSSDASRLWSDEQGAACLAAARRATALAFNLFALEGVHLADVLNLRCAVVQGYAVPGSPPSGWRRDLERREPALCRRLARNEERERQVDPPESRRLTFADVEHWLWPALLMGRWLSYRATVEGGEPKRAHGLEHFFRRRPAPRVLYGVDEALFPRPGYWPPRAVVLGSFLHVGFDSGGGAARAAEAFLDAAAERASKEESGGRGVFVALGAAGTKAAGCLTREAADAIYGGLRDALAATGRVGVVQADEFGYASEAFRGDPKVFVIEGPADHGPIMRRCACVVHHGGAGTTHAAALAARPQVVVPFFFDQFQWAETVEYKEVGFRAEPEGVGAAIVKALGHPYPSSPCYSRCSSLEGSLAKRSAFRGAELLKASFAEGNVTDDSSDDDDDDGDDETRAEDVHLDDGRGGLVVRLPHASPSENAHLENEIFRDACYDDAIWGIKTGDRLVVDVGAHCGLFAVRCASIIGRGARFVCVEPNAATRGLLRVNLRRFCGSRAYTVLPFAAGADDGDATLTAYPRMPGNSTLRPREKRDEHFRGLPADHLFAGAVERPVKVRRLDTILDEREAIALLKIDVEGQERDVLAGAEATLGRTERVVVEVHDIDGRLGECTELLEARGFQTLTQRAPGCMPENHLLFGFRTLPQAIRERLDDEAR